MTPSDLAGRAVLHNPFMVAFRDDPKRESGREDEPGDGSERAADRQINQNTRGNS